MSILKHYNLNEIQPIMRNCNEFFNDLIRAYKIQGISIPDRLKDLKECLENQIDKIEGEVK